eukprot:g5502.t1
MLASRFLRRNVGVVRQRIQRRNFGSNAEVEYTGMEAKIRAVLPKDEHIVLAWIGTMFGLYGVSKLFGGSDKPVAKEEPARVAAAPSSSGESEIPSAFSKSFEEWSKIPGNMKKWEESCKDFDAWMKVPGNKAKYEASLSA